MKRRSFLKAALSLLALPVAAVAALRRKEPDGSSDPQRCPVCGDLMTGWERESGAYSWSCPQGHIGLHGTAMEPGDFYEAIKDMRDQKGWCYRCNSITRFSQQPHVCDPKKLQQAEKMRKAIEVIEDQVMPLAKLLAAGSELFTSNESIASMLRTAKDEPKAAAAFSLVAVESIFDDLVAISSGRPRILESLPSDNATMATVLILREFLHHLQFERIGIQISTDA